MPAVFGDVTGELFLNDSNESVFNTFCLNNVAPCQRIKICFDMDKVSYNSAAEAEGLTGLFDDNLVGITVQSADTLPAQISDLILANDPFLNFSFNSTFSGGCMEFRVPEDWANSLKYILVTYTFNRIGILPLDQDYITIPFRLLMNDVTSQITADVLDDSNNTLERVCDTEDVLQVAFQTTLPDSYDFTPVINISGALEEENGYTNTNFTTLDSPIITSTETDLNDGDAVVVLDGGLLPIGTETCVKGILIKNPINSTSSPCPCLDFQSLSTTAAVNASSININILYSITGASNFQSIQVDVAEAGTTFASFDLGTTSSGNFNIQRFTVADPVVFDYTWNITLTDGCSYTEIITHTNPRVPGAQVSETSQNCGNRGPCSVTLASATQNCLYSIDIPDSSISHTPRSDSRLVDITYTTEVYNDCVSATVPIQATTNTVSVNAGNTGYSTGFTIPMSNGGFIQDIRVCAYYDADCSTLGDGSVVGCLDIDTSSVIYDGVDQVAFRTALQALIETEINNWNIPGVGTGATNNTDYVLTVSMFTNTVLIFFDVKHQPCGLWIGVDRTNAMGTVFHDGV